MKVLKTKLDGVLLLEPDVFGDDRGLFFESFNCDRYSTNGVPGPFVQDNVSVSRRGVLRGLHMQNPNPQGKLVQVLVGKVFDVAVDVRKGSPQFGEWIGEYLSEENRRQLYVPPGFAHGFLVTSDVAVFSYKCTDYYNPKGERTLRWDDPAIDVRWPLTNVILSPKDRVGSLLCELPPDALLEH